MAKKNKKNNGGEQKKEEESGGAAVVLKADFHCDGCASKVIKCIRSFDGVETVAIEGQKITVTGKVDPVKLREKIEQKTHKKVELISPKPKKDGGDNEKTKGKENSGGGDNGKQDKKTESSDKKTSKEKEPPVTTAVLKVNLHCDGCIQRIYKTVTKTKGYQEMKIDRQKDLVTVVGAMDMKALAELLKKQLKKDVEIVPAKKEGGKKEKGDGDKGKTGDGGGGDEKTEGNKMIGYPYPYPYPYPFTYGPGVVGGDQFHYNPHGANQYHAPQIFSDENPNACSVM